MVLCADGETEGFHKTMGVMGITGGEANGSGS